MRQEVEIGRDDLLLGFDEVSTVQTIGAIEKTTTIRTTTVASTS